MNRIALVSGHFNSSWFNKLTTQVSKPGLRNAVLMGRNTWDAISVKNKPFLDRTNIVLTRSGTTKFPLEVPDGVIRANSVDQALNLVPSDVENIFVIGGDSTFEQFIDLCDTIHLMKVHDGSCRHTFIDTLTKGFDIYNDGNVKVENGVSYETIVLKR